jgi:hypothetical protein
VQIDGRWVRRCWREEVTVEKPVFEEVDLHDQDGSVLGKHQVPVFEDIVEPVMEDVQVGSVKSVKYSVLIPILIKALQELAERVDAGEGTGS